MRASRAYERLTVLGTRSRRKRRIPADSGKATGGLGEPLPQLSITSEKGVEFVNRGFDEIIITQLHQDWDDWRTAYRPNLLERYLNARSGDFHLELRVSGAS